jgi:hypothetical protein
MVQEGKYTLVKDIPLGGDNKIKAGTSIYLTNGVFYMDGGLLDQDFQEDFKTLIMREAKNGWNYLRPDEF